MGGMCHSYSPTSKKKKDKKKRNKALVLKTVQIETDGTKKKKIITLF